jgi:competence protein ComEA
MENKGNKCMGEDIMKINYRTVTTVLLSAALLISVLALTGIFDKGDIVLNKTADISTVDVYVVGEVQVPGIYRIRKGAILSDLVEAAGGLRETVDVRYINLAYKIDDNMMIRVLNSSIVKMEDEEGIRILDEELSGLMVNINDAGMNELMLIPGIGEATANAIISFREANGSFTKPEDIMKVTGIKQAKYDLLKEYICVN